MSTKERIIRVSLTLVFIVLGLAMLNHCIFSFWVSTGPPNDYPKSWHQQGIISGWRSMSLFVIAVFCQLKLQTLKTSITVKLITLGMVCGLIYPHIKEQYLIDTCLDNGGSWSATYFECKK